MSKQIAVLDASPALLITPGGTFLVVCTPFQSQFSRLPTRSGLPPPIGFKRSAPFQNFLFSSQNRPFANLESTPSLCTFPLWVKYLCNFSVLMKFAPATVEFLYIRKKTNKFAKIISNGRHAGFTSVTEFC
jgi:hypothetical protein